MDKNFEVRFGLFRAQVSKLLNNTVLKTLKCKGEKFDPCYKMAPRIAKLESALARADGNYKLKNKVFVLLFWTIRINCNWSECFSFGIFE